MLIDFRLHHPCEFPSLEPLWRALVRRGVRAHFILEPPDPGARQPADPNRPAMSSDLFDETRLLLAEHHVPYLTSGHLVDADGVLTADGFDTVSDYHGIKIRTLGAGAAHRDVTSLGIINRGFDAALVPGEFARDCLAPWLPPGRTQLVGHPAHASLLRATVDRVRHATEFGLRPDRRTIVYLPTSGQAGSVDRFAPVLAQLGRHFNLLTMPHPDMAVDPPDGLHALRRSPQVLVADTPRDSVPFLAVADFILADLHGSGLPEALLAERPVIALAPDEDSVGGAAPGLREAVPICSVPGQLGRLLDELLLDDPFASARGNLARHLYQEARGRDHELAAQALIEVVLRQTVPSLVRA